MLPGVEVARRRRVRAGQGRDGGVSRSETHRSRLAKAGAHHHIHLHHTRLCNPQSHLRTQENSQEYRSDNSSASSSNTPNFTERMTDSHSAHRSREDYRGARVASLRRRHSHTDPGGLAMEARNRLDELLQAAAHPAQSSSSGRHHPQSSHTTGFIYFAGNLWREENSRKPSVYEWLATCVLSLKQCLNRLEFTCHRSLSSTNGSEAAIRALPRAVVGDKPTQDECPVCLEGLLAGETTITLVCSHTFHPQCLTPWLSTHSQCPCCRANVTRDKHTPELNSRMLLSVGDLLSFVEASERDSEKKT